MGCGGSRADAIEPRYYESWTRETESTWLTYTDSDALPSAAAPDPGPEAGGLHAGVLEDGLASNGAPRSAISNPEKKISCGTQCSHPQSLASGLRTAEAKRDAKQMLTEEASTSIAATIRPVDRNHRLVKNCVD
ncbi:brain and acute leukemia cytoplasmic protein [Suncus etruscus]|uniref:brain and acute leukemia cytoplasmic protein n=1 Tax=Suncus etruscus TaxID=109475 RepID=UPI00210FEB5B|nr:brain and acute leukemia cytoplasmic protein [Suncus etruscus]